MLFVLLIWSTLYALKSRNWNLVKGLCPQSCSFCFMNQLKQEPLKLDESQIQSDSGTGNFIFYILLHLMIFLIKLFCVLQLEPQSFILKLLSI